MNKDDIYDNIDKRLIIAGINEIEEHGLIDFSLRRVSAACDVSCAAPYKHFKDKDEFILEIIKYISRQWHMLETQVIKIYADNQQKLIEELSMAYIKFWLANPNFRSILFMNPYKMDENQKTAKANIDVTFISVIGKYYEGRNADTEKMIFEIRSLIYGALLIIDNGEMTNDEKSLDIVRNSIRERL